MQPGREQKQDYEYERHGNGNVFMLFEPLAGKRYLKVTSRRTAVDWAQVMKALSDEYYPDAEVIVLVMDNLNTHKPASLYDAFPPAEARRLLERLELHYTPKHGSWLNMAETELSVLSKQCLDRRIPDQPALVDEVAAWETDRNTAECTVDWRFTTDDARIKLKRLYPSIQA
jgi:hypothetical protein